MKVLSEMEQFLLHGVGYCILRDVIILEVSGMTIAY